MAPRSAMFPRLLPLVLVACTPARTDEGLATTAAVTTSIEPPSSDLVTAALPSSLPLEAPRAHPIARIGSATAPGSRVVLGTIGNTRVAFIADEDDRAIHTFDLDRRVDLVRTSVPAAPSQMVIASDGRLYVSLRTGAGILRLGAADSASDPLVSEGTLPTAVEPIGLALAKDGATLYAVTGVSHELDVFAIPSGERTRTVSLPREPRAILIHGRAAFVSHLVGSVMSAVDLDAVDAPTKEISLSGELAAPHYVSCGKLPDDKPVGYARGWMPAVQGVSLVEMRGTLYAPQVNVWSHEGSSTTPHYGPTGISEIPRIAEIDPEKRELHHDSVTIQGAEDLRCLLPRAIVPHPSGTSLLVLCGGVDELIASNLNVDGAYHEASETGAWKVASGAEGMAIDDAHAEVIVFSQFDRAVSVIDLSAPVLAVQYGRPPARAPSFPLLPMAQPLDSAVAAGRILFHTVGDRRISADGRACASCHPDGRDDGLVWSSPRGLRQTPSIAGRVTETAPYGWEGDHSDLEAHIAHTVERRLVGTGLTKDEVAALAAYVRALPLPPAKSSERTAAETRGETIFRSAEAGCSGCHEGASLTDQRKHDVSSGGRFDTPSLLSVGNTAPYFHDGRYTTLRELLRDTDDRMGHTKQLDAGELDDLEAYLSSL